MSKQSPYIDVRSNNRLQKESIMPVEVNKIVCLFLTVLSQYLSSLSLPKLSIYLNCVFINVFERYYILGN